MVENSQCNGVCVGMNELRIEGERSSKNQKFVDAVARANVQLTVERIRTESPVLAEMEKAGSLLIVGAMYDVSSGAVTFLD